MKKELIKINNLNKEFGKVKALNNINLSVYEGEWLAIMGPSGSGKSTLLNILSLMDTPSSGEYILDNENLEQMDEDQKITLRREKIGLVFQQFHLIPYLNALENVMLSQYYHSSVDEEDAKMVLEKVGLSHRLTHLPSQLSGGEQQRVCIARALINGGELILADEPTGALDSKSGIMVLEILQKLNTQGHTIVLVTHDPKIAAQAKRVIEIKDGEILSDTK
ncbi:ABC transporter ATP-binding protein, partial [Clostridioides difficile]